MRNDNLRYFQSSRVASRELEDKLLVISIDDSMLHRLNVTGAFIWKSLKNGATISQLCQELTENFDEIPVDLIESEVQKYVEFMVEKNIVEKRL